MAADASDPPTRPEVAIGRYVLVLGDPAGAAIAPAVSRHPPRPLARAIAQARRGRGPRPTGVASLESASQATSKAEHAVGLFTEIAQGRVDPAAIGDEVEALLGLLGRLDHDEHWEEALRVARSLAMLLALLGRWVDLLQSLQVAVSAAEQLGDDGGKAWALHELGTLHLVAGKHSEADRLLSQAHELRERIGDRHGLAITDRNLQILCRALRALLHEPLGGGALGQLLRIPVQALVFGVLLLLAVGVAAGAIIRGAGNAGEATSRRPLLVRIEPTPTSPRVGGHVAFRAIVQNGADPVHYVWQFGDGEASTIANPTHVYRYLGPHTVTVRVSGVRGTGTGEGARTVVVRSAPPLQLRPNASFSSQPTSPVAGQRVSFDARSSSDPTPHASITSYIWKFGDGRTGTGSTATHRYAERGTYHAELLVADTRGASATTVHRIVVSEATGTTITTTTGNLDSAPEFTSEDSATFIEGTEGNLPVTAMGTPNPTISEEGRLPDDVTFAGDTLSGTPTQLGTYSITFIATNGVGKPARQPFTLTVDSGLR